MSDLKILIVEDQIFVAENLRESFEEMGYVNVECAYDFKGGKEKFDELKSDVILLDIELHDEAGDGIDLARYYKPKGNPIIIFLTGTQKKELSNKALDIDPDNYLVKPYSSNQIEKTIELAIRKRAKKEVVKEEGNASIIQTSKERLLIKDGRTYLCFNISEISYLKSDDNTIELYSRGKRKVLSGYLKDIEKYVEHNDLRRVHKSYIINVELIESITFDHLMIKNGDELVEIPIGPAYRKNLIDIFPPFQKL